MLNQYCAYIHTRPNGTPFYVGKGTIKRANRVVAGRNSHHTHVVDKYGADNIGVRVVICATEVLALEMEIRLIKELRARGYLLTNKTDGGDGRSGWKHTDATKNILSLKMMGRKATPEARLNMSIAQIGKQFSAETRNKMSDAMRGRVVSLTTREKHRSNMAGNNHNQNGLKTHCKRGHEFSVANTYLVKRGRACVACQTMRNVACRKKEESN